MGRSNFALIAALYQSKGGLYSDIYFPIMKYAIVKIYEEKGTIGDCYGQATEVHDKILELFGIKIPHEVIARTVMKLSLQKDKGLDLTPYEDGQTFLIRYAKFDEQELSYTDRESIFKRHLSEIEAEYEQFTQREGTSDDNVSFVGFITKNTDNLLGYFEKGTENKVEEKYASMVFFLEYLNRENNELYIVASQLFWSSVIVAFLQSERPKVKEDECGSEAEYFLDTPIVLGLLDLSSPENRQRALDVSDIITSSGGMVRIHPATIEEINTILSSVIDKGPYPGTGIYSAYMRREMDRIDVVRVKTCLIKEIENAGLDIFPVYSERIRKEIMNRYNGKTVLKDLANSRNGSMEYTASYTFDQYREAHDIFMDDYICERREKTRKQNVFFLTTNNDLIKFCRKRHPEKNYMISTAKVILEMWMHNAKPAQVSSGILTETMARCLDMHRSKVRDRLQFVAQMFNKHKEDVPAEMYSHILKLLYRRARNIVKAVEELPQDNSKAAMEMIQHAIKEDYAYFDARNSEINSRNEQLTEEVTKRAEEVKKLEEDSEEKSRHIGCLTSKNENLSADKQHLTSSLKLTEEKLKAEKTLSEEEHKGRIMAENKNKIYARKEMLENQLAKLKEALRPWNTKRVNSYSKREFIEFTALSIPLLFLFPLTLYSYIKEGQINILYVFMFNGMLAILVVYELFYNREKRRNARKERAYKKWESKPENQEYTRLTSEIMKLEEEIQHCKDLLKKQDVKELIENV